MVTVTVMGIDQEPFGEGVDLSLLGGQGQVLSRAQTDAAGVATFDIDAGAGSEVARLRLELPDEAPGDER